MDRHYSLQGASGSNHGFILVSYNAGISACEKCEQWQRALALLSEMREAKLEPDVISTTVGALNKVHLLFGRGSAVP